MIDLRGCRVGILEARLASEAAALVRRHGGVPVAAPALREEPFPAGPAVAAFLDELSAGRIGLVGVADGRWRDGRLPRGGGTGARGRAA